MRVPVAKPAPREGLGLRAHEQLAGRGDDAGEEHLGRVHQRERRHDLAHEVRGVRFFRASARARPS